MISQQNENGISRNNDFLKEQQQDVASNFMAIFSDFNYDDEMELLNVGRLSLLLRKNLSFEFDALYVALWYSCLKVSFPQNFDEIFTVFIDKELPKKYKSDKLQELINKIQQYIELLGNEAGKDLTPIAHHLLSFLKFDEAGQSAYEMKITLHLRKVYKYIFERLI